MTSGLSQRTLRWPVLLCITLVLLLELLLYTLVRVLVSSYEAIARHLTLNRQVKELKRRMRAAWTFTEWCSIAREMDAAEGRDEWKEEKRSPFFDWEVVEARLAALREARQVRDCRALMRHLMTFYSTRNFSGINNYQLYNQTHFGTKRIVHDLVQEVLECTILVRDEESLPLTLRIEWLKRAKRSYGKMALLLSGGAGMGFFHLGVLKALHEAKCLPSVLSGASAGSLMTGFLAVRHDDELKELFQPSIARLFRACHESWATRIVRWLSKRYLFDVNDWMVRVRRDVTRGDITFAEAYSKTGRIANITITAASKYVPNVILNHKSTPDVLIWSAILASSAMPNIIQPIELLCKDASGKIRPFHVHGKTWTDGTIKNDVPVKEISALHNCSFSIVSQVNPHLIPFFYKSRGSSGRPSNRNWGSQYRGGFVLSALERLLKLEMRKWLQLLSELDLLPTVFGTDWRFIFLQPVMGTVTLVPAAPICSYFKMLSDPTEDDMRQYISIGERATWNSLARISNHYRFERLLTDCKAFLERQAKHPQSLQISTFAGASDSIRGHSEDEDETGADHSDIVSEVLDQPVVLEPRSGAPIAVSRPIGAPASQQLSLRRSSVDRQKLQEAIEAAVNAATEKPIVSNDTWSKMDKLDDIKELSPTVPPQTVPVVFDLEGQAYSTYDSDEDEDDSLPASPLRNL